MMCLAVSAIRRQAGTAVCLCAVLALIPGCGSKGEPASVSGTVTVGGEPVANGAIRFQSADGGNSVGTDIKAGKYSIDEEKGLVAGSYKVMVVQIVKLRRPVRSPEKLDGGDVEGLGDKETSQIDTDTITIDGGEVLLTAGANTKPLKLAHPGRGDD